MTDPARQRPTLVTCEPYGARLTETACAKRHRRAKRLGSSLADSSCRTCPEGAARAKAKGLKQQGNTRGYERTGREREDHSRRGQVQVRCGCGRARWVNVGYEVDRVVGKVCAKCMRAHAKLEHTQAVAYREFSYEHQIARQEACRRAERMTPAEQRQRWRKAGADARRLKATPGERLGGWTVVGPSEPYADGKTRVRARCDCGVERTFQYASLRYRRPSGCRSCAAYRRESREVADAAE